MLKYILIPSCTTLCICAASLLLDNLLSYLTSAEQNLCKAVYLHVLTTNKTAIQFYERRNFRRHNFLPFYYSIGGTARDGYCYVLYINGGQPPWSLLYPLRGFMKYIYICVVYYDYLPVPCDLQCLTLMRDVIRCLVS